MAGRWDFENLRFWKNVRVPFFKNQQKMVFEKIQIWEQLLESKSPLSAIHKIIWHIWEPRSRKVNNDEPDLRFFHGNFWPVISHAVRKPCFSTSIPRGPNPGFPDAAGAGRILKPRSRPLPTHPGMKYFREETLAVDKCWFCLVWIYFRITRRSISCVIFFFDFGYSVWE